MQRDTIWAMFLSAFHCHAYAMMQAAQQVVDGTEAELRLLLGPTSIPLGTKSKV
jgi:hypothetical protein